MTTAELLIAVDDAVAAAFPERAAGLLAVVRRWIWFSAAMDPLPPDNADAAVVPSERYYRCSWCARGGYWARSVLIADPPRRGEVRWQRRRRGTGSSPRAVLCGSCAILGAQIADPQHPAPDQVLADLSRALSGTDDGARASEELGRRAGAARVPARARDRHCDLCGGHPDAGCIGRDPLFLCRECLAAARAAVFAGPPPPHPDVR